MLCVKHSSKNANYISALKAARKVKLRHSFLDNGSVLFTNGSICGASNRNV